MNEQLECGPMLQRIDELRQELENERGRRQCAEQGLLPAEMATEQLFQQNPLPMWIYETMTLRFVEVNEAAVRQYGYSREEMLSMRIADIRPAEEAGLERDLEKPQPAYQRAYQRTSDWKHMRKDGTILNVDVVSHAMRLGGRECRLVAALDVTERVKTEARLQRARRLEAIGRLTGGIAHDFNNLMTIIHGSLQAVEERAGDDPVIAESLRDAQQSVARGVKLTRRLLAYARKQPLNPRVVHLDQLLMTVGERLENRLGESVRVKRSVPQDLWRTKIDPAHLEDALLSLAGNAQDAMPEGGTLTIEARNVALGAADIERDSDTAPGEYVLVKVTDNGTGMPGHVRDRALEPFFTTKAVGAGDGLGLSMVYGFVKQSGGHMRVRSQPGLGTAVTLFLPRTEAERPEASVAHAEKQALAGPAGELVLVVEDDAAIRRLMLRMLEALGYRTLEAEDGPTAVRILAATPGIDLLLTDIVLPNGLNGVEVAERAQDLYPGINVLFVSGYTRDALTSRGLDQSRIPLLAKPFGRAELARAVRGVLEQAGAWQQPRLWSQEAGPCCGPAEAATLEVTRVRLQPSYSSVEG